MTQSTNKFEQLLELLINEENEKAEQMFHEIVVEKSRDIYENLADSETETATTEAKDETKDEAKEEDKKDESVKEDSEKADEKAEDKKEDAKEEAKTEAKTDESIPAVLVKQPAPAQKSDEESIEEIGGDATDELVKDIASDENGDADAAADEIGQDMDADGDENGEEGDTEERVSDLEDALDELKAEFEKMMAGGNGDEEAEEQALAPVVPAQETQPEMSIEGKDAKEDAKAKAEAKAETKETVKEYKIKKTADNKDHADSGKSPVASRGKDLGGTSVKTGSGAEDKGRPAPKAETMGNFENSPGKDKSTSMKKEVKADTKDHSDKSAKSPVKSA